MFSCVAEVILFHVWNALDNLQNLQSFFKGSCLIGRRNHFLKQLLMHPHPKRGSCVQRKPLASCCRTCSKEEMRIALPSGPRLMTCTECRSDEKAKVKLEATIQISVLQTDLQQLEMVKNIEHPPTTGSVARSNSARIACCCWQLCSKHTLE